MSKDKGKETSSFDRKQVVLFALCICIGRESRKKPHTKNFNGEFDPGSGRTLAVCLTHASRTRFFFLFTFVYKRMIAVADG